MKPSELLREKGWCQLTGRDYEGRSCLIGSCTISNGAGYFSNVVRPKLLKHLNVKSISFASWNDAVGRTKDEVIGILEAVGE